MSFLAFNSKPPVRVRITPLAPIPFAAMRGFTLIELMVTVAVLAVIVTLAAPSFASLISGNRMTTRTTELIGALNVAHSEAVRRAQPVTLRSTNIDNYSLGWTVFPDADANGSAASNTDDKDGLPLRVTAAFNGNATITRVTRSTPPAPYTYTNATDARRGYVVFDSRGSITAPLPAFFKVCDPSNTSVRGRIVQVNVVGKVSLDSTTETCP
jgi:type IV fimbrial biogenesis protein FimT